MSAYRRPVRQREKLSDSIACFNTDKRHGFSVLYLRGRTLPESFRRTDCQSGAKGKSSFSGIPPGPGFSPSGSRYLPFPFPPGGPWHGGFGGYVLRRTCCRRRQPGNQGIYPPRRKRPSVPAQKCRGFCSSYPYSGPKSFSEK